MPNRVLLKTRQLLAPCAIFLLSTLGCTDERLKQPGTGTTESTGSSSEYAIKAVVKRGEQYRAVRIVPGDLGYRNRTAEETATSEAQAATDGPGLQPLATIRLPDGGTIDTNERDDVGTPGMTLLVWAARSCLLDGGADEADVSDIFSAWEEPFNQAYIFLQRPDDNCSELLFQQQTLLCAADKLAQVAASVGTTSWTSAEVLNDPGQPAPGPITVIVPPQASEDKFIARDVALNALAHLVRWHTRIPVGAARTSSIRTCADGYIYMAENGAEPNDIGLLTAAEDAETENGDEMRALARLKLATQANISVAAVRLIRELVEGSVSDDLAGAEKLRASVGDPKEGLELMWGVRPGRPPYNTLKHALRVLFGRWELNIEESPNQFLWDPLGLDAITETDSRGRTRWDPQCKRNANGVIQTLQGFTALEILDALDFGFEGRWSDLPPKTPDQAFALSTFDRAGIVIPNFFPELSNSQQVRDAIKAQLIRNAAKEAETDYALFLTQNATQADAIKATVDTLDDEDIRFGLDRVYDAFGLLADVDGSLLVPNMLGDTTLKTPAETAGLKVRPLAQTPEVSGLSGIVVDGGLPRRALGGDIMARVGRAQGSSQCGLDVGDFDLGTDLDYWSYEGGQIAAMQDVFSMVDILRRQLAVLRERTTAANLDDISRLASVAVAEAREWAEGRIVRSTNGTGTTSSFHTIGLQAGDFGASSILDLNGAVVFVPDSPIIADCVAGIRPADACPSLTGKFVEQTTATAVDLTTTASGQGLDSPTMTVTYNVANAVAGFLVLKPTPGVNGGKGKVLGYFTSVSGSANYIDTFTSVAISSAQRRLANSVFALAAPERPHRSCSNIAPTTLPTQYCNLKDMTRDMFVPLANELTSANDGTEDSWRHYLQIAEEAAAKTDELGRQIIDLGLQKDIRKEAATEEVGRLCGVYPNTGTVSAESGKFKPTADSSEINACIAPENIDVVFLRKDPYGSDQQTLAVSDKICADLCAGPTSEDPPFCNKCVDGMPPHATAVISHAGLEFDTLIPEPIEDEGRCDGLINAYDVQTDELDTVAFHTEAKSFWASPPGLASALQGLNLLERQDGHWLLSLNNVAIMGTFVALQAAVIAEVTAQNPGATPAEIAEKVADHIDKVGKDIWPACSLPPLGECSAPSNQVSRFFADVPLTGPTLSPLLRQLESAVFYLGALAGTIPQQHVGMFLPAANRAVLASNIGIPAPALYGAGHFSAASGGMFDLVAGDFRGAIPWGGQDKIAQAVASDSNGASAALETTRPTWLTQIYQEVQTRGSPGYLLVPTANSEITFPSFPEIPGGVLDPQGRTGRDAIATWLQQLSQTFAGCVDGPVKQLLLDASATSIGTSGAREVCPFAQGPASFRVTPDGLVARQRFEAGSLDTPRFGMAMVQGLSTFSQDCTVNMQITENCSGVFLESPNAPLPFLCSGAPTAGSPTGQWVLWGDRCMQYHPTTSPGNTDLTDAIAQSAPTIFALGHDRYRPKHCSPGERVEMFLNRTLGTDCDAMRTLVRALGLSCLTEAAVEPPLGEVPPTIRSVDDIRMLEVWMSRAAITVKTALDAMYVVNVPQTVIDAVMEDRANFAATGQGERGQLALELGKNLNRIENGFAQIGGEFRKLQGAIRQARLGVQGADLNAESAQLRIAFQKLEIDRQLAIGEIQRSREELAGFLKVVSGGINAGTVADNWDLIVKNSAFPGLAAVGGFAERGAEIYDTFVLGQELHDTNVDSMRKQKGNLGGQGTVTGQENTNQIDVALSTLSGIADSIYQAIDDHLAQVSDNQATALQNLNSLAQNQSSASIELAKATGADFVSVGDGVVLPIPVNTVMRRQFGVLNERYKRSLEGAKRAAYLARLAIEQRLGTRMNDLVENIGPIEAPSLWVDDLCSVTGINYKALKKDTASASNTVGEGSGDVPTNGGNEVDLIRGFADQYIGDYVARLKEFVEFYNIKYPFRQGDDTAVVSLREDLRTAETRCVAESKNVLFYSDRLDALAPDPESEDPGTGAWKVTGCTETTCIDVASGAAVLNTTNPPVLLSPPGDAGAATWLRTTTRTSLGLDRAGTDQDVLPTVETGPAPAMAVYQSVLLRAGQRYALSWWDMARDANGLPYTAMPAPQKYRVSVSTSDWISLAFESFEPVKPGASGTTWSDRRELWFVAPQDGTYVVAFSPSEDGATGASLAIANVQLEATKGDTFAASDYESIGATRMVLTGGCPVDAAATFRNRFQYMCGTDGCFYELKDPFIVDVEMLGQGFSSLIGKVAVGNYNYRNTTIGVNVVGTGVLDCGSGSSPSCFGTSYLEYDLTHSAYKIPMIDYVGDVRCFNFGTGAIRSGKAVTAERYITLPMGSADRDLLSQAAFLKQEFNGRPLSGSYRLRIKANPALVFEKVEDVQLIFNYHYWSRVDRGPGQ